MDTYELGLGVKMDLERKDEEEEEAFMATAAASIEKQARKRCGGGGGYGGGGGLKWRSEAAVWRGVVEIRRKEDLKKREKARQKRMAMNILPIPIILFCTLSPTTTNKQIIRTTLTTKQTIKPRMLNFWISNFFKHTKNTSYIQYNAPSSNSARLIT